MKDSLLYIEHMLEAVRLIQEYSRGVSYDEFAQNKELQDAVVRRLEIIGEASNRVPEEIKSAYPQVPWKKILGMRNIIVHDYMGVDLQEVWNVIQHDLASLKGILEKIFKHPAE